MKRSRKSAPLLALVALALTAPAGAQAGVPGDCTVNPADPACISAPTPATATLTVTPPSAGRVTSTSTIPSIDCGPGGTPTCSSSAIYLCVLGPTSCAVFAPTLTLTAADAPAGKLPQWSSNCTAMPADAYSCSLKVFTTATVSLTWIDDPSAAPAGPSTTVSDPDDRGQQQQQQQQPAPVVTPAKAACKVPKLKGKTLKAARKALKQAHCAVGKVKRKKAKHRKPGRVLAQSVRAGKTRPNGTKVALTVSRRA